MKDISALIDSYREEMIAMLCDLIRFPSLEAAPEEGKPFGKAVDDCLQYALKRAEEFGLKTENVDGYIGQADIGEGDKTMGILVHLDVVPPGEGWDSDPFEPVIKDGCIFGRGANDNKAATVTTLYALKACREVGVEFKKKVRVLFGCNEETGWKDFDYYKTKYKMPDFGYSPDGSFPVINAEKGVIHLELLIPLKGDDNKLLQLTGGERANVVIDRAEALVGGDFDFDFDFDLTGFGDITATKRDDGTFLRSAGLAAHGAKPELGVNAAVLLMQMLRSNGLSGNVIDLVCDCVGEHTNGAGFGINFSDEPSGDLSLNLGILEKQGENVRAVLDIRYPVTTPRADVIGGVSKLAEKYGATVSVGHEHHPIFLPEDHPWIKVLLEQYTKTTGKPGYTLSMGGGTYARTMDNAVAFGGGFPDTGDHGVHKQNEYVAIDDMLTACKVFANVIAAVQEIDLPL